MEVILLERVHNLGNVGDLTKVKNGYARNFLIPFKKAIRATEESKVAFEAKRSELEKENAAKKKEAEKLSSKIHDKFLILIRQAAEDGRLYGSVSAKDIADGANEVADIAVKRSQVVNFLPIKYLGVHSIKIALHPEVEVNVFVNVARSNDEAEIAKKEFLNPTKKKTEGEENKEGADILENQATEDGTPKKKKKKIHKVVDIEVKEEVSNTEESAEKN